MPVINGHLTVIKKMLKKASLPFSVDQLAYGETNSQTKGEGKAIVEGRFNSGGQV